MEYGRPMTGRRQGLSLAIAAILLAAPASASAQSGFAINTTPIEIPATMGPATPYPSQIPVSGMTGAVADVGVGLNGFVDSGPTSDVGVVLVSPAGRALVLMAGAGSSASGVDLNLSDHAPDELPGSGALASGSYRPTNLSGTAFDFPSPGPGSSYGNPGPQGDGTATFASAFGGDPPNGTWSLYVVDSSASGSAGSFASGWRLSLATAVPQPIGTPARHSCGKKRHKKRTAESAKKKHKKHGCKKKKKKQRKKKR
jgi:hypothetical protein